MQNRTRTHNAHSSKHEHRHGQANTNPQAPEPQHRGVRRKENKAHPHRPETPRASETASEIATATSRRCKQTGDKEAGMTGREGEGRNRDLQVFRAVRSQRPQALPGRTIWNWPVSCSVPANPYTAPRRRLFSCVLFLVARIFNNQTKSERKI